MLKGAEPEVAETHGAAVASEGEGTFTHLLFVFRDNTMAGFTVNLFVEQHEDAVVEHGDTSGRGEFIAVEFWREEENVKGLPLAGWPRGIHQRRGLAVNGPASAIRVNFFIKRVEDLDFEQTHEHDAVIAAVVPRPFEIGGRHPLDVQLHVAEAVHSGEVRIARDEAAIGDFPVAESVPFGDILAVEQDDSISRDGGWRESLARVNAFWVGAVG